MPPHNTRTEALSIADANDATDFQKEWSRCKLETKHEDAI